MKIGVYGGTYNPPHLGHITAARAVFDLLELDRLLLIPAGIPPHKTMPEGSATALQRLEMTRLAGEQTGLGDKVPVVAGWLNRAAVNPAEYNVERKFSSDINDWIYTVK